MARSFVSASSQFVERQVNPVTVAPATFACWYYPTSFASTAVPWGMCTTSNTNGHTCLVALTTGKLRMESASTGNNAVDADTTVGLTLNAWNHLAGVVLAGSEIVYLNGANKVTKTQTIGFVGASAFLDAGRLGGLNVDYCNGRIAECAIWDAQLTDAEIAALASGVASSRIRADALAVYWPLWGVASPEPDLSGHGYNGTVTGATRADHAPVGLYVPAAPPFMATGGAPVARASRSFAVFVG